MQRWLANVFRLGLKELASLASDKVLAGFIVYSFSFAVYSHASGVKTEVTNAPVAIVDADRSALAARIEDGFLKPYFRRPDFIDRAEVDRAMDRGTYSFVLELPPHLEANVLRGRSPALQLNIDATAMTYARIGGSYVDAIVQQETQNYLQSRGIDAQMPVRAVTRAHFNPNLEGVRFQAVMSVLDAVTMLSILLVGAAVIREHGTIEHLLAMPVRPSEIAAAKIWANGLVIVVATALSLVFVVGQVLNVPIAGSIPLFIAGAAVYLFALASFGILLATVANSMPQFALLALPMYLILNLLSGSVSPLESMPEGLQTGLQLSPAVHFIKLAQSVLHRGAGIEVVWPQIAVLALMGAAFLAVALARFRKMMAKAA
jgi:ABC-2 type transport system permease protein